MRKQKEGCARIVIWDEFKIDLAYTMEATYSGFDLGIYKVGFRTVSQMERSSHTSNGMPGLANTNVHTANHWPQLLSRSPQIGRSRITHRRDRRSVRGSFRHESCLCTRQTVSFSLVCTSRSSAVLVFV